MGDLKRWQKLALWAADNFPKNKLSQDLAYKIILDPQVGYQAGATTKDVARNVFSSKPKEEDTNKYMFVYGADTRRPETTIGQAYDWSEDIRENGYENVKTYSGVLNPYNEYLVDSRNKGLVEEFAKVGYSPVSNINNEYIDWNTYRLKQGTPYFDDVHGYRPTFHFNNGKPVISSSDLYDFGKNYNRDFADLYVERSGSEKDPAFTMELQRRALNSVGQPYLLVQKNIPIRFVNNPQGNEIWRTNNFNKELRLDEMSDREISDILHTGYIEPAVVTAYKTGGRIHIKKKNRGKFTESAERAGMGVQEYARHILANKDKYSSTLVKRANFARNAKKFKHENGGIIKYQNPAKPFPQVKTAATFSDWLRGTWSYLSGNKDSKLLESQYRPTKETNPNIKYYYRDGLNTDVIKNILGGTDYGKKNRFGENLYYKDFNDVWNRLSTAGGRAERNTDNSHLGAYTISIGEDDKGRYISYYDKFDWAPAGLPEIFHPYEIYNRIYEDEFNNTQSNLKNITYSGYNPSGNWFFKSGFEQYNNVKR